MVTSMSLWEVNHNDHQNDKVPREMIDLFKQHHPNLNIKCNLNIVDYLDITFDLTAKSSAIYTGGNTEIYFKTYFIEFP